MSGTLTVPVSTSTVTSEQSPSTTAAPLVLHLTTPAEASSSAPRVSWTTDTVDNEHAGKKKSKCCCIYKKPKNWEDSSSDSDSDCETDHCRGHVDKKKKGGCGEGCNH